MQTRVSGRNAGPSVDTVCDGAHEDRRAASTGREVPHGACVVVLSGGVPAGQSHRSRYPASHRLVSGHRRGEQRQDEYETCPHVVRRGVVVCIDDTDTVECYEGVF